MNTPTDRPVADAADPYASLKRCLRARKENNPHGSYPDETCVKAADTIQLLQTALASQIEITNTERGHAEKAARQLQSAQGGDTAPAAQVDDAKAAHNARWCRMASERLPPWQWNMVNDAVRREEREATALNPDVSGGSEPANFFLRPLDTPDEDSGTGRFA